MAINNTSAVQDMAAAYLSGDSAGVSSKKSEYGKTVGEPKLSEEGKKYYEELKKKYGQYDFILVSKDQVANAKSQAARYANPMKPVVLIDEDKIEKMATDKDYREKYEGIISGAGAGLDKLKESVAASGAKVEGYGIQVNDGGMTSYFAVLKKSGDAQKERIEKNRVKAREEHKAEAKKAEKKKAEKKKTEERLKELKAEKEEETVISASSIEELKQKLESYAQDERMNSVLTEDEKLVGSSIDFKG